jgi:hypothetical protein
MCHVIGLGRLCVHVHRTCRAPLAAVPFVWHIGVRQEPVYGGNSLGDPEDVEIWMDTPNSNKAV